MKTILTTIWLIGMPVLGYYLGLMAELEKVVSVGLAIIFFIIAAIVRWGTCVTGDVPEAAWEMWD